MKGNYAENRDHLNDPELGTGIYDKSASKPKYEPVLCSNCREPVENPWYGATMCYACRREAREMEQQECGTLEILVGYIPPEPEQQAAELRADADWLGDCILLSDDSDLGESPTETRNSIDF